ncbi:MAG: zinc ribbon domain-containing protein [Solirubrobacterales bacterium]
MSVTDPIVDLFDRIRPARKVPAARRRAEKSEVLGSGVKVENDKLREERDRLAREFVVLQWDLGGLTYEMARRDHFRLDVLAKQAAKLQQVDSSLGQAERMVRLEQEGVAGSCSSCGALQARGAAFCWQCGTELVTSAPVTGQVPAGEPIG